MNFKNLLANSPYLLLPCSCLSRLHATSPQAVQKALDDSSSAEQNRVFAELQDMASRGLVRKSAIAGMFFELSKLGRRKQSIIRTH